VCSVYCVYDVCAGVVVECGGHAGGGGVASSEKVCCGAATAVIGNALQVPVDKRSTDDPHCYMMDGRVA
jgi:hypothetical protein